MTQVWKYPLRPDELTISAPLGAIWLSAHKQGDDICVWAEVNASEKTIRKYTFEVYGTGHPMLDSRVPRRFLGTVLLQDERLVFHVYVQGER